MFPYDVKVKIVSSINIFFKLKKKKTEKQMWEKKYIV